MDINLIEAYSYFKTAPDFCSYGNGHINDTYISSSSPKYILQKINSKIFLHPEEVMENIINVTDHIRKKLIKLGKDAERGTLTLIETIDGHYYHEDSSGSFYRMYKYIENTICYETAPDYFILFQAGCALGYFQKLLSDYPASSLHETITDFHNTPKRLLDFKAAVHNNIAGRRQTAEAEIERILSYSSYADIITGEIAKGTVPLRVTHNDTKLNNLLFDKSTREAVCMIDLDTVMPGSLLYDFGDALRTAASSAAEDETDLDRVWFDLEKYKEFYNGYMREASEFLTPEEKELLPVSAFIMTYECAMRFLTDYLNGDTYFKTSYKTHNLDRARNQLKLAADIKKKLLCDM